MSAVHALIIFSEIIGFDHTTICIKKILYRKNIFTIVFYAHAEFGRFS